MPYPGTPGPTSATPYPATPDQASAAPYPNAQIPTSGTPYPGAPGPTTGTPYPTAQNPTIGAPYPTAQHPASAAPYSNAPHPTTGTPYPGAPGPTSGTPYPGTPSAPPYPTSGASPSYGFDYAPDPTSAQPYGPFHGTSETPSPYGLGAPTGRRIEPSPKPPRSRLLLGVLAGLVAGLILFGAGGFFAGRATAPDGDPQGTPTQLGVFEQSQAAINQQDFAGTGLTTLSQGWLPHLSTCSRSGTPGGPKLNDGEKARVRCTLDGMSAIFVEYDSPADRDEARVKALERAVEARTLTPGVAPMTERVSPSGRTTGNYLEYAYRLTESGTTRTISGIWWDDAQAPVAGYLLAYWDEAVGGKWEPMRDLWSRYA